MKYDNILDAVGRTPLVRLHRLSAGLAPAMYAKVDYLNPGGSVKDRIALRMIDDAERKGLLEPGGTIAIYVYKKKAPIREYTDDFIREKIEGLRYDDAMEACHQITELGRALADLDVQVTVPDIDLLEIPAGEYDVQRLVYHFFMKCFWNPELNFEDNTAVNYDWYHPSLCSRHQVDQVREWFENSGLTITHTFVDFYGITVHGTRPRDL